MTSTFPQVSRLIGQQVSFNALEAIQAVALGYDTPLVDECGLRDEVEAIRAAGEKEVLAEVAFQKQALHRVLLRPLGRVVGTSSEGPEGPCGGSCRGHSCGGPGVPGVICESLGPLCCKEAPEPQD